MIQKSTRFTFVDLFCGIGGFHQAMATLGGQCVFACDISTLCREVYQNNYLIHSDDFIVESDIKEAIKKHNIPNFDVLCGGFPCQTFSKAGNRNGFKVVEKDNGQSDERGQLFYSIIDVLKEHPECKYIILENVRNLADNKENWQIVCDELKKLDFVITDIPIIESPHRFGIPQVRERVYILGTRTNCIKNKTLSARLSIDRELLNIESHYQSCPDNSIPMLLDDVPNPKYFVSEELSAVLDIWEEFLQNVKEIKSPFWLHKAGLGIYDDATYKRDQTIGFDEMPEWKQKLVMKSRKIYIDNKEFIDKWTAKYNMTKRSLIHQKFEWNASKNCKSIKEGIIQFRQSGVRVKNPDYFPSLVAMNNTPIVWDSVNQRYRYLSPKEAAKLQSFKTDFQFCENDAVSYRQLGNSVNVKLVKLLAEALFQL